MLSRSLSLLFSIALIIGCVSSSAQAGGLVKANKQTQQTRNLSRFNKVSIKADVNVNLHTGYSKPKVILQGDPRDIAEIYTYINQGTLHITSGKSFPKYGPLTVDIRGKFLNSFAYEGTGFIKGTRLRSSALSLKLDNQGKTLLKGQLGIPRLEVHGQGTTEIHGINSRSMQVITKGKPKLLLNGKANLTSVNLDGDAQFAFYWINSPLIRVCARGCAEIQLAGVVDRLDVELWGCSKFKGRYLRANRSFVKTHDKSVAEISTVGKQHTLASDASDIYFYNVPNMQTNFMAYNGSVLDMREWPLSAIQEYDRYNKHIP